jgi:hypothetical protein
MEQYSMMRAFFLLIEPKVPLKTLSYYLSNKRKTELSYAGWTFALSERSTSQLAFVIAGLITSPDTNWSSRIYLIIPLPLEF